MPEPHKIKIKLCKQCGAQEAATVPVCSQCGERLPASIQIYAEGTSIREKYNIIKLLGHGGMGAVYHARHPRLERDVALKFIHPRLLKDQKQIERLRREAVAASSVDHPNALRVIDIDEDEEGNPFLVTEFLQGQDIERLLHNETLSLPRICHLLGQVLDALAVAHEQGVVHRDLKPGNLFLVSKRSGGEQIKIVDFGLAKLLERDNENSDLTTKGTTLGTPYYMSPEQVRGEPLDGRSDLWAVGVILYQMMTGQLPFSGPSPMHTALMVLKDEPEPPSQRTAQPLPAALEALCMRAILKDRTQRPQTAAEFREALALAAQSLGELSPAPASPPQSRPTTTTNSFSSRLLRKERRVTVTLAFFGMLIGGGAAVFLLWPSKPPAPAAPTQAPPPIAASKPSPAATSASSAPASSPKAPDTLAATTKPKKIVVAAVVEPAPIKPPTPSTPTPPPTEPDPNLTEEQLGKMLFLKKDFGGAIPHFETALQEKPNDAALHRRLGDAYHQTGQNAKAITQWREFLRLAPNHADAPKVRSDIEAYQ